MKKVLIATLIGVMLCTVAYGADNVNIMPNTGIEVTGQIAVATAGTQVRVGGGSIKSVLIKANSDNTGNIFVGTSTVSSTTGLILVPGEFVSMDVSDLGNVWVDCATNGDGVSYLATQ